MLLAYIASLTRTAQGCLQHPINHTYQKQFLLPKTLFLQLTTSHARTPIRFFLYTRLNRLARYLPTYLTIFQFREYSIHVCARDLQRATRQISLTHSFLPSYSLESLRSISTFLSDPDCYFNFNFDNTHLTYLTYP